MSFSLFMDGDFSERTGKIITFIVTMVSMAVGLTLIPLLPQPLPIIIAFLVAGAVYNDRPWGIMAGSLIISLGLVYHLSRIGFFQIFPGPLQKIIILAFLISPFIICPAMATNNLQIIAMDIGIIAVSLLFFRSTFYLAIPLILVFATIYKGKGLAFTFAYYAFISIPLQIMQYLKIFSSEVLPPLYTPLDIIYTDIQGALRFITLEELGKVLDTIGDVVLSRGFERYITSVPYSMRESFSSYIKNEFYTYRMTREVIIPSHLIDSFMGIIKTNIPTYANSTLPNYIKTTLPDFTFRTLPQEILNNLPNANTHDIHAYVNATFPEYLNTVFTAYFHDANKQLLNSVPGIVLFLVIMIGFISAIAFLNMNMPDPVRTGVLPRRFVNALVYILPIVAAALTNLIFFVAIDTLQKPLYFKAVVNQSIILNSMGFTILFSAPVAFSKYLSDLKEVRSSRADALTDETAELLNTVDRYLKIIEMLGPHIPENMIELRTKIRIVQDELRDMNQSSSSGNLELNDIDSLIRKVYNGIRPDIKPFDVHLDVALRDYYIKIKFEYLEAVGEITDLGIEIEAPAIPEMNLEASLEEKAGYINQIVKAGRVLVEKLIDTSDKIYEIISGLFEPNLPRNSATLQISKEKIDEDEPWVIIDAILVSLKNWEKQYSADILNATRPINDSVEAIVQLSKRKKSLIPLLGEKYDVIQMLSEKVSNKNLLASDESMEVLKVIVIRDTILSTVDIVSRIIDLLYSHIKELENMISQLLPREDYEWNRNLTLTERMDQSLEVINNYEKYGIEDIISHLYRVLSYIDEAVDTIEYYNERKEMLLNYGVFEKKITRLLEQKGEVTLSELGTAEKYGREYLKMYHRTNYSSLMLEERSDSLRRTSSD